MGYLERWREIIPPGHWAQGDPALTAFYTALAQQADELVAGIHAAVTWLSPRNADAEGLSRWEKLLGIGSDGSLETRRSRVMARLVGYGTIRREVLAAIAAAFGATVTIEEIPDQYKFIVRFQSPLGEPPYAADLQRVYDEVGRATWQYEIIYVFSTWADWSVRTWGEIQGAGLTWEQMRSTTP